MLKFIFCLIIWAIIGLFLYVCFSVGKDSDYSENIEEMEKYDE